MKKHLKFIIVLIISLLSLTGCTSGGKTTSISIIYGIAVAFSALILVGYIFLVKSRHSGFILLFSSILVVNIGYLLLALSDTLQNALWANRISYLGSVFLMPTMLISILNICQIKFRRWLPITLAAIGLFMFLVAASPGILDIYYKEVSLQIINGVAVLNKVYGPLHMLYLFYLLGYFGAMIGAVAYSIIKKKVSSTTHCIILIFAVFVNIGVWLMEQFIKLDIEILSVSYIISELFLLALHLIIQESERILSSASTDERSVSDKDANDGHSSEEFLELCDFFERALPSLTHTEKLIYDFYLEGKTTKEIMAELDITENTLKYHNKNIYSKLGVPSRKRLLEVARAIGSR
ncbi:MAG: hypothetical protein IKY44_05515 [Clostridia bacterium]|nr:hypothetical protein [Clostridia bacterium]